MTTARTRSASPMITGERERAAVHLAQRGAARREADPAGAAAGRRVRHVPGRAPGTGRRVRRQAGYHRRGPGMPGRRVRGRVRPRRV